jgi:hypothetical protein
VHVAAVQFSDPTVTIAFDVDPAEAKREHWRQFEDAARDGYLVGSAHIAFPGLGHIRREADKTYTFVPLVYSSAV